MIALVARLLYLLGWIFGARARTRAGHTDVRERSRNAWRRWTREDIGIELQGIGCGHVPRPGVCGGCKLTRDDR